MRLKNLLTVNGSLKKHVYTLVFSCDQEQKEKRTKKRSIEKAP